MDRSIGEYVVIRPPTPWAAPSLREFWQYRDLLLTLAGRDLTLRYRQTALGVIWVVLQPLIGTLIFVVVFSRVARLPTDGLPPLLFIFAGLSAWQVFSSTVSKASGSLVSNRNMISKIYFPRALMPLAPMLSSLVDYAIAMVVLGVMMAIYGVAPSWGLVLLPVWLLLLMMLASGIGFCASATAVSYRDVQHMVPVMLQFLLFASPIGYSTRGLAESVSWLYQYNPITGLMQGFRWSLLGQGAPQAGQVLFSAGCSLVVFLAGLVYFTNTERKFADVI